MQAYFLKGNLLSGWFTAGDDANVSMKVTGGMLEIFYLNKQHPFAPYNWLATSAVVCCDQLPQMNVTRLQHLYSVAFPVQASAQRVMGCLCQQIYLLKFRPLSCDTCSNSNKDVTIVWKRGVSYSMTPSYIDAKEWGVRTKVVIDWNTLNYVDFPPDWNQFYPFL